MLVAGVGAAALGLWYIKMRKENRVQPAEKIDDKVLHPEYGTPQQVATNRYQQQHRDLPPSKKSTQEFPEKEKRLWNDDMLERTNTRSEQERKQRHEEEEED